MYYMNDGVYGSFASKLSEDLNTIPEVHKASLITIIIKPAYLAVSEWAAIFRMHPSLKIVSIFGCAGSSTAQAFL